MKLYAHAVRLAVAVLASFVCLKGESMLPDFKPGYMYPVSAPDSLRHGDVVLCRQGREYGGLIVKRIVAMPGDSLRAFRLPEPVTGRGGPVVEAHRVYLKGDNWRHSRDSRHFGTIHIHNIIGIVEQE